MATDEPELLTVREVARRCHRSEETIRRWIWSGKLPARKLGNQLFIESSAVTPENPKSDLLPSTPQYTQEEMIAWAKKARRLQDRLFKKYGYFDVAAAVRESRDSH